MREYKIKRGHNADVGSLVNKHYGAKGDIYKGMKFEIQNICL